MPIVIRDVRLNSERTHVRPSAVNNRIKASHREQGGHQLDTVPQVLYSEIFVEAVLIVVVVADRNHDRTRAKRSLDRLERQTTAHRWQLDGAAADAFDRPDDFLGNRQIHWRARAHAGLADDDFRHFRVRAALVGGRLAVDDEEALLADV